MTTVPATNVPDVSLVADVIVDDAAVASMGPPITGPTALGNDARRFRRLAWTLAITDFKLKFFGSVLGYLWQLMRPLMMFGILYVVFSVFLKFSKGPHFAVSLLLGIVLFGFYSEATSQAVRSLWAREPLVRKIDFPRMAVPVSVLVLAFINFALNMIPVFVFLLASGGSVTWSWLEFPLIVIGLTAFAFGMAMLLSALFVRFRDIEPIWDVVMQALFYGSAIFWLISSVSLTVRRIVLANPFAAALEQARHALVSTQYPSVSEAMGGKIWLAIPAVIALTAIVIGFVVFVRTAPTIAEDL